MPANRYWQPPVSGTRERAWVIATSTPFASSKQISPVLRWLSMTVHEMPSAVMELASVLPHVEWWQLVIIVTVSRCARLLSRQQAERARRRTLEMLVKTAPAGTVVVQEAGLGGPGGTVWLGPGNSTQPGESA
jgi:hypothetical protein